MATPEPVRRYIEHFEQRIERLEVMVARLVRRIEELESRLNRNSQNASKTPNSDPPYQRPARGSNGADFIARRMMLPPNLGWLG